MIKDVHINNPKFFFEGEGRGMTPLMEELARKQVIRNVLAG